MHRWPSARANQFVEAGAKGGMTVTVDAAKRQSTQRHHTARHLLHAALRNVLGDHVRQAGSLVAPDRLRFDYSHFESPAPLEGALIEQRVNDWIMANAEVSWREMPIAEAEAQGAMALFGEKYGERVRMVTVEGVPDAGIEASRELCGGTHVRRTGDIGSVRGHRRIRGRERRASHRGAVRAGRTHMAARRARARCPPILDMLETPQFKVVETIGKLQDELALLKKQVTQASRQGLEAQLLQLAQTATEAPGGRWVVARIETPAEQPRCAMRPTSCAMRSVAARRCSRSSTRPSSRSSPWSPTISSPRRSCAPTNSCARWPRSQAVRGGKPHLSLAGGRDMGKLDEALELARTKLTQALS
jgi:alanyl-tRNA synthetase